MVPSGVAALARHGHGSWWNEARARAAAFLMKSTSPQGQRSFNAASGRVCRRRTWL